MPDSQHTPGPWSVNFTKLNGDEIGWHIVSDKHGSSLPIAVADKYGVERGSAEKANAKLIAAAPDLYKELYERSKLLGCVKMCLLQNDPQSAIDLLRDYRVTFTDGPIIESPSIAKAAGNE